jgi:hypothetical protein
MSSLNNEEKPSYKVETKHEKEYHEATENGRFAHVAAHPCIVFHLDGNVRCCVLGIAHLPLGLRRV